MSELDSGILKELQRISLEIHQHPELGFEEMFAHTILTDFLSQQSGFQVTRNYKLDTAFRAEFRTSAEVIHPHVVVFSEFDALPGLGHACGHNLIAVVGVATALLIKNMLIEKQIPGRVTLLGSPAEEGGGGKVLLMDKGAISQEDVDFAIMSHPGTFNFAFPNTLSATQLTVTFRGRAVHATVPWEGLNALDAAVAAYNNISLMRQQMKPKWRVHGIFTKAGEKANIIPEETQLQYMLRAPIARELDQLIAMATPCFTSAAQATGCTMELNWDMRYDAVNQNQTLAKSYKKHAQEQGLSFEDEELGRGGILGSTDMGNVSWKVPAIHPWFFVGKNIPGHTKEFVEVAQTEEAFTLSMKSATSLALAAVEVMNDPDLLKAVLRDFEKSINI